MKSFSQKLALFVGMGSLFVAVSEFWFYSVDAETDSLGIILFYSVFAYVFVLSAIYFRVRTFAGLFVAASLFGILTESVPVPVLFSAMPFTILWTSLAWHALITVMLFWYGYRTMLQCCSIKKKLLYCTLMGVGLGLWNSFMWNVSIDDATEVHTYNWGDPALFLSQFLFGYVLFVAGHLLYGYGVSSVVAVSKYEWWTLVAVIGLAFAAGSAIIAFPLSLMLLPLVYVCYWALRRQYNPDQVSSLFSAPLSTVPVYQHLYSIVIALSAIGTYYAAYHARLEFEANVVLILTAGPLATYWFVKSLYLCAKRRASPPLLSAHA